MLVSLVHYYTFIVLGRSDLMIFVTLGLMMGLYMMPHTPANIGKRMAMLFGFAFTNGKRLTSYNVVSSSSIIITRTILIFNPLNCHVT